MNDSKHPEMTPEWCLVGNVRDGVQAGPAGSEPTSGTKHFRAGAKVYCVPPMWGDGYETIKVIGHHRGSGEFVTMTMPSRHITNWRARLVYSPEVIRRLDEHGYHWAQSDVHAYVRMLQERDGVKRKPWWKFW